MNLKSQCRVFGTSCDHAMLCRQSIRVIFLQVMILLGTYSNLVCNFLSVTPICTGTP